jgi:hypothetical protein
MSQRAAVESVKAEAVQNTDATAAITIRVFIVNSPPAVSACNTTLDFDNFSTQWPKKTTLSDMGLVAFTPITVGNPLKTTLDW